MKILLFIAFSLLVSCAPNKFYPGERVKIKDTDIVGIIERVNIENVYTIRYTDSEGTQRVHYFREALLERIPNK